MKIDQVGQIKKNGDLELLGTIPMVYHKTVEYGNDVIHNAKLELRAEILFIDEFDDQSEYIRITGTGWLKRGFPVKANNGFDRENADDYLYADLMGNAKQRFIDLSERGIIPTYDDIMNPKPAHPNQEQMYFKQLFKEGDVPEFNTNKLEDNFIRITTINFSIL